MTKQTNQTPIGSDQVEAQPKSQDSTSKQLQKTAPYEAALLKAFDKLTSQVLIFLLAYVILLISLSIFGSDISKTLSSLLYIIPILGVGAYLFQHRRGIASKAEKKGINVKAGIVTHEARVAGVRGAPTTGLVPENVDVGVRVASGKSRVDGVVFGEEESDRPQPSDEAYLLDTFRQLDIVNRRKLISSAQRYLEKLEKPDA